MKDLGYVRYLIIDVNKLTLVEKANNICSVFW